MKNYKRLTFKKSENASNASYDELLNRLVELEDKIENGTLIEAESTCIEEKFDYICKYYENGLCHLGGELFGVPPQLCNCINDFENCMGSKPIEYEKESSPYSLNSTEINVFSKLLKEYIKDQDKLEKLVEAFESYLSNAVKSPANAEGKWDNEDTLYRIIKERVEDKEESYPFTLKYDRVETAKLMPDNGIDKRALTIQNCDKIILKPKSLEVEVKIEKDNFDDFDFIEINGHKFKKV